MSNFKNLTLNFNVYFDTTQNTLQMEFEILFWTIEDDFF